MLNSGLSSLDVYVHVILMSTSVSHHAIYEMQEAESQKGERDFIRSFVTRVDAHFNSLLREK